MTKPSDHNPKGILKFVKGDATNPQGSSNRYILQIVNDTGTYDGTFSKALSKRWPKVEAEYRQQWRERFGKLPLGSLQVIQILSDLVVINMIAQKGLVTESNPNPIDYPSLKTCLSLAGQVVSQYNASIHMPRLNNWEDVEPLIDAELLKRGINVTVYDL